MPFSCNVSSQNAGPLHFNIDRCDLAKSGTISLFGLQTIFVRSVKENLSEDSVQKNDFSKTCSKVTFICKFRCAPKKSKS